MIVRRRCHRFTGAKPPRDLYPLLAPRQHHPHFSYRQRRLIHFLQSVAMTAVSRSHRAGLVEGRVEVAHAFLQPDLISRFPALDASPSSVLPYYADCRKLPNYPRPAFQAARLKVPGFPPGWATLEAALGGLSALGLSDPSWRELRGHASPGDARTPPGRALAALAVTAKWSPLYTNFTLSAQHFFRKGCDSVQPQPWVVAERSAADKCVLPPAVVDCSHGANDSALASLVQQRLQVGHGFWIRLWSYEFERRPLGAWILASAWHVVSSL